MHTIWKFPVQPTSVLELPAGAQFLCVQTQNDAPQSWWLVDPSAALERRTFIVYGTGHVVQDAERLRYLGTFQLQGGALVFHLFEVT